MVATGKRIASLMQSQNLCVRDLQEFFGFNAPRAIYKWLRGECLPSIDNCIILSTLLDVSIDYLLTGKHHESSLRSYGITSNAPREASYKSSFTYYLISKNVA